MTDKTEGTEGTAKTVIGMIYSPCNKVCSKVLINWKALLLGQILALILTGSGAAVATLHLECNFSAPATQITLVYFLLSLIILCTFAANYITHSNCSCDKSRTRSSSRYGGVRKTECDNTCDTNYDNDTHSNVLHNNNTITTTPAADFESALKLGQSEERHAHNNCSSSMPPTPSRLITMIKGSLWTYFILAFLNVEGNYCTYLALRYTTLTSVILLGAFSTLSSMFFSYLILSRSYRWSHLVGVMLCLLGVFLNLTGDSQKQNDADDRDGNDGLEGEDRGGVSSSSNFHDRVLGDFLAILANIFYGLGFAISEKRIKDLGRMQEYLGMIGLLGTCIGTLQAIILEWDTLSLLFGGGSIGGLNDIDALGDETGIEESMACPRSKGLLILAAGTICSTTAFIGMGYFLSFSEAALLSISCLTSNVWSVAFSIVVAGIFPSMFFWIALVLIVFGVILYELSPSSIASSCDSSELFNKDVGCNDIEEHDERNIV